jgi:hypothetical protein
MNSTRFSNNSTHSQINSTRSPNNSTHSRMNSTREKNNDHSTLPRNTLIVKQ